MSAVCECVRVCRESERVSEGEIVENSGTSAEQTFNPLADMFKRGSGEGGGGAEDEARGRGS